VKLTICKECTAKRHKIVAHEEGKCDAEGTREVAAILKLRPKEKK